MKVIFSSKSLKVVFSFGSDIPGDLEKPISLGRNRPHVCYSEKEIEWIRGHPLYKSGVIYEIEEEINK